MLNQDVILSIQHYLNNSDYLSSKLVSKLFDTSITSKEILYRKYHTRTLSSLASEGNLPGVKYLLSVGISDSQAIIHASQHNRLEVVRLLLPLADIKNKSVSLAMAALFGYIDCMHLLVENGADVHFEDDMPARYAAGVGYLDILKYLESVGADLHTREEACLWTAAGRDHFDVVEYLIMDGAIVNLHRLRWVSPEMAEYIRQFI